MKLLLTRDVFTMTTTLGRLDVDGLPFGFTCEDEDRGLDAGMGLAELASLKVAKETAIPAGHYLVGITWSQRYGCDMPEVLKVPGFRGIRIHPGNTESDTAGCLLPGTRRDVRKAMVLHSTAAFEWLFERFRGGVAKGERIEIEIVREPAAWKATGRA